MLASSSLALVLPAAGPARAQSATWLASPGSNDYNTPGNWDTGFLPAGVNPAFFDVSNTTAVNVSIFTAIGGWTLNAGASNYTFTIGSIATTMFTGAGMVINGGSAAIIVNGTLTFVSGTASSASITNNNEVSFLVNSTAGSSVITNDGTLTFNGIATAGTATITNSAGRTTGFRDGSTAGNAQLINNGAGAVFDFSVSTGPNGDNKLSAGSIAGNGTFNLGANELTVGGNNLSTTVSGVISGSGSLVKTGTGTLTLSGANTYTGATTVSAGFVDIRGSLASSTITNNATLGYSSSASAGSAAITNNFFLDFWNTATAGSATITNSYILNFNGASTAGNAVIVNDGYVYFKQTSTADNAGLTNNSLGTIEFRNSSNAGIGTTITNAGVVDFSGTAGQNNDNKVSAGSIAGSGTFSLGANELTVGSNTQSTVFSGTIADGGTSGGTGGSLVKTGPGTLTLSGANTYTGGTTISGGTLQIGNGGTSGSITGNIVNNSALIFNRSDAVTYAGVVSGTGTLQKLGGGTLTLTGASTYTGNTTISAGTLQIGNGGTSGSITGNIINNSALIYNRSNAVTYAGVISGTGTLEKISGGTLTLTGTNTYTGDTTISAGTLQIGNGGTTGSVIGNIINNSAVIYNRSNTITYAGAISGIGTLQKLGGGTLTLTGANTYTGDTTISAGTLQIGNGGTTGSIIGNLINNSALIYNRSNAVTYAGVISGTGTLQKLGGGTLTLTGANTYTDDTTISAGTLQIGNGGTSGSITGNIVNNSALIFDRSDAVSFGGTISGIGTMRKQGAGTLTLTGTNTFQGGTTITSGLINFANGGNLGTGNVTLNGGGLQWATGNTTDISSRLNAIGTSGATLDTNGNDVTFATALTGTGGVTKTGAGILALTGIGTYQGGTTITGGLINFASGSLGSGNITLNGGGLQWATGNTTDISSRLNTIGANGATFETFGNNVTLSTGLTGSGGLTKTGGGTLTLSGTNAYTGATTISGGTLSISGSLTSSTITNSSYLNFRGNGTAGNATIVNTSGVSLNDTSSLGNATIANHGGMYLEDNASAGNATIVNDGNYLDFYDNSTAANATIINSVFMQMVSNSSAGNAHFTNLSAGRIFIYNFTTLADSTFINSGEITFSDGGNLGHHPTAGNANITNNASGTITFGSGSTAGSAMITNAGTVSFTTGVYGGGTAGDAQLTNNAASAVFDFSNSVGPNSDNKVSAGSIAGNGTFSLGTNQLTVGSNNRSTNVTGLIADGGAGGGTGASLLKTGTGTLTLSGTNTYTGATTVDGGALVVNGSIATSSSITVNSGGTLGGSGQLPTSVINSGATLAPGNSIGTITVNGNLTFNNGGIYAVEASPTAADRTNVTGTATLTGATVQATALAGSFRAQSYTILNATGGLGGTQFAGLTFTGSSISPGARNPHLTYDANNVFLVLDPGTLQLPSGANGNQAGVAGAINKFVESGGAPPAAFDVLLNMGSTQLTNALNQVSGQPAGGASSAGTQMTTSFMTTMLTPFSGGGNNSGGGALGYARGFGASDTPKAAEAYAAVTPKDKQMMAESFDRRWSLWGSGYGGTNQRGGDTATGSADTSARTYGFATGADYRPAADWLAGFALAGGNTSWSLSQGLGGGKSDVFQIGGFASKAFGAAYISGALSYAWHDVTTDRTVTVSGVDKLEARYHAHSFGARFEAGYRLLTPWLGVTPYAALQAQSFRTPSYGETATSGSNTFALTYNAKTSKTLRTELGSWLDKSFMLDNGDMITVRSRAAWAHDQANDNGINAAFQTLPGSSFTVNGAAAPKNAALVSLGGEWQRGRITLGARFDGEFAKGSQSYSGTGSIRYGW